LIVVLTRLSEEAMLRPGRSVSSVNAGQTEQRHCIYQQHMLVNKTVRRADYFAMTPRGCADGPRCSAKLTIKIEESI